MGNNASDHIKTALELALEKLASEPMPVIDTARDTHVNEGRKLAASYLRGTAADLAGTLKKSSADIRPLIEEGIRDIFLKNLVLPRTANALKECRRVLEGLALLQGNKGTTLQLCGQAQQICEEYLGQTKQLTDQLRNEFKQQAVMMEQRAQAQSGMDVHIAPEQLPDFQKQFQAQFIQLNDYFTNLLNEIKQRFTSDQ